MFSTFVGRQQLKITAKNRIKKFDFCLRQCPYIADGEKALNAHLFNEHSLGSLCSEVSNAYLLYVQTVFKRGFTYLYFAILDLGKAFDISLFTVLPLSLNI